MKNLLYFIAFFLIIGCAGSKMPNDLKRHIKTKNASRIKGTVEVSMDTIFYKGEPWGIMRMAPGYVSMYPGFTIHTLQDELVIAVRPADEVDSTFTEENAYLIYFLSSEIEHPSFYPAFLRRRQLATDLVLHQIIKDNALNTTGIRNFQRLFKPYIGER